MTKRAMWLAQARVAGYHQDAAAFTRLCIEARVSRPHLNAAWGTGARARAAGVPCDCINCSKVAPTIGGAR